VSTQTSQARQPTLRGSSAPLASRYDVALLDLDGVVYLGRAAVTGAPQALASAREHGMRLAFVTNNAARTPEQVAAQLRELGVPADPWEVITSSQAAAHYLAERLPARARVLVIGADGLVEALRERDLVPVFSADDEPAAVVQGYSPDTNWRMLAEGAIAIQRGVPWVATNIDATLPSARGPLPGNGSLVAALRHATGATPVVTGKPEPTMHRETVERSGAQHPIVVGDRLDTDVEGARAVGCPSLLVLTGVTTPALLLEAPERLRPDYIAADLGGLLIAHPEPIVDRAGARCGVWSATRNGTALTLRAATSGTDRSTGDELDALRALCAAAWTWSNDAGVVRVEGTDADANAVLGRLSLA
jgi:HAD superfamily hydrolase (TIGR01450 family)